MNLLFELLFVVFFLYKVLTRYKATKFIIFIHYYMLTLRAHLWMCLCRCVSYMDYYLIHKSVDAEFIYSYNLSLHSCIRWSRNKVFSFLCALDSCFVVLFTIFLFKNYLLFFFYISTFKIYASKVLFLILLIKRDISDQFGEYLLRFPMRCISLCQIIFVLVFFLPSIQMKWNASENYSVSN